MENAVVFKGSLDGIIAILAEETPFNEVKAELIQKLESAKTFFKGASVNIRFKGRKLSKKEQEELVKLLREQTVINVGLIHQFEDEELETPAMTNEVSMLLNELEKNNVSLTQYHYGVVRSGQHLTYPGSIVILGDVNPGAVISAKGNVIVIGTLNGYVHAGKGEKNKKCFVLAINMHPMQITIGDVIAQPPEGEIVKRNRNQVPQIAYLANNVIYVEEIDVKTLSHMVE